MEKQIVELEYGSNTKEILQNKKQLDYLFADIGDSSVFDDLIHSVINDMKDKNMSNNNLITNSAIELSEDLDVSKKGKGRKFVSRFIESGVAHYKEFGDVLITKETLDKFIHTMVGCPVIINHKDISDKNVEKERVGVISNVWYEPLDGWYYCDGIIWDKDAIALVKNEHWNVSCSYDFKTDFESKTHNGKKIDMEFTDGEFLHLALVDTPRYERANIVVNSEDKEMNVENDDKWITIKPNGEDAKGRHLLLKDGETPKQAIDRVYKKDKKEDGKKFEKALKDAEKKLDKKEETKKDNVVSIFDYKFKNERLMEKFINKFQKGDNYLGLYKASRLYGAMNKTYIEKNIDEKLTDEEYKDFKEDLKYLADKGDEALKEDKIEIKDTPQSLAIKTELEKQREQDAKQEPKKEEKTYTFKDKKYTAKQLVDEGFHPMKYGASIFKDDKLTYLEKTEGKMLYKVPISEEQYRELSKYKQGKEDNKIAKDKQETLKRLDERVHKDNLAFYGSEEKIKEYNGSQYELNKMKKVYDILRKEDRKLFDEVTEIGQKKAHEHSRAMQPQISTIRKYIYQTMLDMKNGKVNNSKERKENLTMTVLNELENFVRTIVENKCAKKEVENEKDDKRKLIDEVAGMLKSAGADDEVIRTAIGKMEKIAYEKSEDGTADNEKDVKEEKFDEEKEIVENEVIDVEEEEVKDKEDIKKDDKKEVKEEVKEDAKIEEKADKKEKVDNSIDKAKEIIYNGVKSEVKHYATKDERLELGNNY